MKFSVKVTKSVNPPSSFVESITIDGDIATVKMKNRSTLYHYQLDKGTREAIASIDRGTSAGQIYNQFLRGKSVAKTVYN